MKKTSITLLLIMAPFFIVGSVLAWEVPGMEKKANTAPAPTVSIDEALKSQSALVKIYTAGQQSNLKASSLMLDALGKKEDAAKYETEANAINSGNCDSDCLKKNQQTTAEASKKTEELLAKSTGLSADAKKKVGDSLVPMGQSVLYFKTAVDSSKASFDNAQSVLGSASLMDKLSVKSQMAPTLFIMPEVPNDLINVGKTLKQYIDFAKSNQIAVPKEATEATEALGNL